MANALPFLERLGSHRHIVLHEQSAWQAGQMRRLSEQLRRARRIRGYSRPDLATALGVDVALVVALENGYGSLEAARWVLAQARRLSAASTAG